MPLNKEPEGHGPSAVLATVLQWMVTLASIAYLLLYLVIALRRITYPFDLEWMEGGSVDHVRRLLAGQHIYVAPSLAFVPYCYPPFYYYVSAVVARVMSVGLLPLRLVSFASSIGSFILLYYLVQRETGQTHAGLLAAGLFAATYRLGGAWFDLARIDSLFLALILAAAYTVRFGETARAWALAGVLAALSALTKQTALLIFPFLAMYAAFVNWRRALVLIATWGLVLGATTLALDRAQHGWYLYYVVRVPLGLQRVSWRNADFWRMDLLMALPIACAVACAYLTVSALQRRATSVFYLCLTVGLVGASWTTRMHFGAYTNVLMPAYACLAIVLALASHELPALVGGRYRPQLAVCLSALCLVQFTGLRYSAAPLVPTSRDVALEQRLVRLMTDASGDVYLANHGYFPQLAGKPSTAHSQAVDDVLHGGEIEDRQRLLNEIHQTLQAHRFGLIVLDRVDPWLKADLQQYYRLDGPVFDEKGLRTVTGARRRPLWKYVPALGGLAERSAPAYP